MKTESWIKIILGWLTAALIGIGGWFLYVRDSFADRPTASAVEKKIESAAKPTAEKIKDHREQIKTHTMEIREMQIADAAHAEIHKAQTEAISTQNTQLNTIQADLRKILRRLPRDGD